MNNDTPNPELIQKDLDVAEQLISENQFDLAIAKLIELNPFYREAYLLRAQLYKDMGEVALAEHDLIQVERLTQLH